MKNEVVLRPTYWASVSGGKDSLYMLKLILQNPQRYKLDGVVHFELEIDYPFVKNVIDYMENECKRYKIPFVRIRPDKTWMELYAEKGFPNRKVRWCNDYKLDALRKLKEFLRSRGEELYCYIGYCYDEERRYRKNTHDIFPLVDFRINEKDILQWAKNVTIFNDFYKINTRCGCMICPMQSRMNMAYMLKYYPEEYKIMMELAKRTEDEKGFTVFNGNKKYNVEYMDKIVREKWMPKLEEKLRIEREESEK